MEWVQPKINPGEKWNIFVLIAVQKTRYGRGSLFAVRSVDTVSCTRSVRRALFNLRRGSTPPEPIYLVLQGIDRATKNTYRCITCIIYGQVEFCRRVTLHLPHKDRP